MSQKRIIILGAAGRVGSQICSELLRSNHHVVMTDLLPQGRLEQKAWRLLNDACLATHHCMGRVSVYGDFDALDKAALTRLFEQEKPDLVINYAIPITWDATKQLPNYARISAAGLGAFTPLQVLVPLLVGEAIAAAGIKCAYMVGNLPDMTLPVIAGIARSGSVATPSCGAGNVGLNHIALQRQVALDRNCALQEVNVALVAHHIHWVAPREPGYSNAAPFLARVMVNGEDITDSFPDVRAVMNRGVQNLYEPDASFSSTTGILASRVANALLDDTGATHKLHAPGPNGLPGGYPLSIQGGQVAVDLPDDWTLEEATTAMRHCHTLNGIEKIEDNGTVHFAQYSRDILREEVGLELPAVMSPGDIRQVAGDQIDCLTRRFNR